MFWIPLLTVLASLGLVASGMLWWMGRSKAQQLQHAQQARTAELLQLHRRRAYLDEALDALGRAPVELSPDLDGKLRLELPLPQSWRLDLRPWNVKPPGFEPELTLELGPEERLRIRTGIDGLAAEIHRALAAPLADLAGRKLHLGIRDGALFLEAPTRPDALPVAKLVSALEALPTTLWAGWTEANGLRSGDEAITGELGGYRVHLHARTQPPPRGQVRLTVQLEHPLVGLRWAERPGATGAWSHDGDLSGLQRRLRRTDPSLIDGLFRAYPRSRITFEHVELVLEYWPTPITLGTELQRAIELARSLDQAFESGP